MALTQFGFIVTGDDFVQHQGTARFSMKVVGVRRPEQGIEAAKVMVAEGIQLIELCGGSAPVGGQDHRSHRLRSAGRRGGVWPRVDRGDVPALCGLSRCYGESHESKARRVRTRSRADAGVVSFLAAPRSRKTPQGYLVQPEEGHRRGHEERPDDPDASLPRSNTRRPLDRRRPEVGGGDLEADRLGGVRGAQASRRVRDQQGEDRREEEPEQGQAEEAEPAALVGPRSSARPAVHRWSPRAAASGWTGDSSVPRTRGGPPSSCPSRSRPKSPPTTAATPRPSVRRL